MAKNKDLDKIHEANLHIALQERSGALQRGFALSEITGRHHYKVELHHILGRDIPEGFEQAPEMVKEFWPHVPPGCLFLTTAEHRAAEASSKMMRPLLLAWILLRYTDIMWQGRTYGHWLNQPPFSRFLA